MKNRRCKQILTAILVVLLTACGDPTPPMELAPNGQVIQKAIALQLRQAEQQLSQQLRASNPEFEIFQIDVKQLKPIYVEDLPTYHLRGTYNLKIKLPRQRVTQKNNFDIYLQRQKEGKTWRLVKREVGSLDTEPRWTTYLIK